MDDHFQKLSLAHITHKSDTIYKITKADAFNESMLWYIVVIKKNISLGWHLILGVCFLVQLELYFLLAQHVTQGLGCGFHRCQVVD